MSGEHQKERHLIVILILTAPWIFFLLLVIAFVVEHTQF